MTRTYKGFTLYHCHCGYRKMAWIIFFGYTYKDVAKTLKDAKEMVNEFIAFDK